MCGWPEKLRLLRAACCLWVIFAVMIGWPFVNGWTRSLEKPPAIWRAIAALLRLC